MNTRIIGAAEEEKKNGGARLGGGGQLELNATRFGVAGSANHNKHRLNRDMQQYHDSADDDNMEERLEAMQERLDNLMRD